MHDQKRWFVFQNDGSLLLHTHNTVLHDKDVAIIKPYFIRQFSLGVVDNTDYHCAEIAQAYSMPDLCQPQVFRQALAFLTHEKYRLAVKAHSILSWDKNHRFCGRCGAETLEKKPEFERTCPLCELSFFPRISPSILVRIQKGDQILMARSPYFPVGVYGLIAGFVDTGESLEQAVHREVKEEVGITIKNLRYVRSQPWPFPDSLMMGFTADYDSGELVIDENEIEAAGWYSYDDLPGRPSMAFSMGAILIDDFIESMTARGREKRDNI